MNAHAAMEEYLKEHPGAVKDLSAGIATAGEAVFFMSRHMTEDQFKPLREDAVNALKFLGHILDIMNTAGSPLPAVAPSPTPGSTVPGSTAPVSAETPAEVPISGPALFTPQVLSIPDQFLMMNVSPNPAFAMTDRVRALAMGGAPLKEVLSDALNAGVSISQVIELWDKHRAK